LTQAAPAVRRTPLRTFDFGLSLQAGFAYSSAAKPSFGVKDRYIAGVRTISGLSFTVGPHELWEGGNNFSRHVNPEKVTWEPLVLEQGLAVDDTLVQWAEAARSYALTGKVDDTRPVKRHLIIDMFKPRTPDQAPLAVHQRFVVINAWVSKLVLLPKLDAMASEVALSTLEIVHEGWFADDPRP